MQFVQSIKLDMPKASIGVTSICSDEGLMTPGAAPEGYSDWPTADIYVDGGDNQHPYGFTSEAEVDVDAFIIRALAAASKVYTYYQKGFLAHLSRKSDSE